MITAEQLKDVVARVDALHHYLGIDKKEKLSSKKSNFVPKHPTFGTMLTEHESKWKR